MNVKLKELFEELYRVREERIIVIKDMTSDYLKSLDSAMSIRDYFILYLDCDLWCFTSTEFDTLSKIDWFT